MSTLTYNHYFDIHIMFRTMPPNDADGIYHSPCDSNVIQAFSMFLRRHKIDIPMIYIPLKVLLSFLQMYPLTAFLLSKKERISQNTICVHLLVMENGKPSIQTYKTFEEAKEVVAQSGQLHDQLLDFDNKTGNIYLQETK